MRDSRRAKNIFVIVTTRCNLRCSYCYESGKASATASPATIKERLSNELAMPGYDSYDIIFHGGEPMTEFDIVQEISEWLWSSYPSRDIQCLMTTNGTVLSPASRQWLEKNHRRFAVTLSLDGGRDTHNRNRCGSFDLIDFNFFHALWPEQRVKMTVSPDTIDTMYDDIQEILALGFRVNPSLAMEVDWDMDTAPATLCRELDKLVRYYLAHPDMYPCPMLTLSPALLAFPERVPRNKACGAGTQVVAYDVQGNKYPCHSFITNFKAKYNAEAIDIAFNRLHTEDGLSLSPKCKDCMIFPHCEPCYGMNYSRRNDMGNFDPTVCTFNKIKVKAAAVMYGQMILGGKKYRLLQDATDQQLNDIILGIKNIQQHLQ